MRRIDASDGECVWITTRGWAPRSLRMWARPLVARMTCVGTSISARSATKSPPTMYQTSTGSPAFCTAVACWNTRRSAPPRERPRTAIATAGGAAGPPASGKERNVSHRSEPGPRGQGAQLGQQLIEAGDGLSWHGAEVVRVPPEVEHLTVMEVAQRRGRCASDGAPTPRQGVPVGRSARRAARRWSLAPRGVARARTRRRLGGSA